MAKVALKNINKVYSNNVEAIRNLTLEIDDGEFIVFVGPSGCGKSTILQLIAGLEDVTSGEVWIDGQMVNDVEPKDRDIAMVFQNYALYPYKTVYQNMAFGLRMHKVKKDVIKQRVEHVAELLDLSDVLDRRPSELSGGQRQRVAMGRAMVREPKVFLMDEPLSNLDAKLRTSLRRELIRLHRELNATFVYVTHDQTEAMTLATRIVVLNKGVIQQVDTPQRIHDAPANMFVAGFIGSPAMNFLPGRCRKVDGQIKVEIAGTLLDLPSAKEAAVAEQGYADAEVVIGIRPEDISDAPEMAARYPGDVLMMTVDTYEMTGSDAYLYFHLDDDQAKDGAGRAELLVRTDVRTTSRPGDKVALALNPDRLHLFDPKTQRAIAS